MHETQAQFAGRLGLKSYVWLCRIERGRVPISRPIQIIYESLKKEKINLREGF